MPPPLLAPFDPANNPHVHTIKNNYRILNLKTILEIADKNGFGVVACNARSSHILRACLRAAFETKSPIILEIAESEMGYCDMPPKKVSDLAHTAIEKFIEEYGYSIPVCLHHDHVQKDVAGCLQRTIEAGFSSIEVDLSKKPLDENIKGCIEVINKAHPLGISVEVEEGEIGSAAALADPTVEAHIADYYTKAEDAVKLVSSTRPDALAFFVGNGHGQYLKKPIIGYERIREITEAVRPFGVYGVLHGGTGLTPEDFNKAIANGARKFNYATALSDIWFRYFPAELLKKMDEYAASQNKPRRYILNHFLDEVNKLDFSAAEKEIEEHVKFMMEKAFLSAGKADLY